MQNTLSLVKDVRGCMTRFDPLTPEIVADQTEDGLTYDELKEVLEQCGMDIEKVVFDGSRAFQNAFYADFEQGLGRLLRHGSSDHRQTHFDRSVLPHPAAAQRISICVSD